MNIILNVVRLIIVITAFIAMNEAMDLSKDVVKDYITVDSNRKTSYWQSTPSGSLGASSGFAIMSGLCFVALGLTFIRQDS